MESFAQYPNVVEALEKRAADLGVNLAQVCRIADVDRSTLVKWKREEPQTLRILRALHSTLDEIKAGKGSTEPADAA